MSNDLLWTLVSFAVMFFFNVPIVFGLIFSSCVYLFLSGIDPSMVTQKLIGGMDSFILLAIPLFILAAELMNTLGLSKRIYGFALSLVGRIPGSLAHTNVLSSMIFAGMSGSSAADAAGIGVMEIKAMNDEGYDPAFSAAVTAASSTIGPIIPPSIPMVVYGSIAGVSVGKLFMGGLVPGIIMGLLMMVICYFDAVKNGFRSTGAVSLRQFIKIFMDSVWGLLGPVILLGGIYAGLFTPTEAAAVAAVYALLIGILVYKELDLKSLREILSKTVVGSAMVLLIIGAANLFGWIIANEGIPNLLTEAFISFTDNKYVALLLINVLFLILGCFMEINAIMLLFLPILIPVVTNLGVDLVHFGVVTVLNMMIGTLTPPFGMMTFIVTGIAKVPLARVFQKLTPFVIALLALLILITYVPDVVMWLPNTMK
ncbi:MAG: TRAP transporter large permease [Bacteroidota bacterium]